VVTADRCCQLNSKHSPFRGRIAPERRNAHAVSHPFVERLIGTIRREYLDRVFFWNAVDLARKLEAFRDYYNGHRAIAGLTPAQFAGALSPAPAALDHYGWQQHCRGLFEIPVAA